MPKFLKKLFWIIFIIVFIVVAVFITINVTKLIFNRVAGGITEQAIDLFTPADLIKSLTGGSSKIVKKPCNMPRHEREFKSQYYYTGPLIDSHVHFPTNSKIVSSAANQNGLELPVMEGDLAASNLICIFESEGITKTFAFHITSKFAEGAGVSAAKEIEGAYPGKIIHFIMPPPVKSLNVDPDGIGKILNGNKGLFKGFGEIGLYMDGYEGTKPNDPQLKEIYKLAYEHNLIVMIHPEDNLKTGIEEILSEFPNVNFFFHGGRDQEWLIELMPKYKNFYYSLDGDLASLYGHGGTRQFKSSEVKEEYLKYIRKNFDKMLEEALTRYKMLIEKYPDRFTWGTDRWYEWHFDPEVGGLLEEFGRSFIGNLDESVQENFAYKNAEKMLELR